MLWVIFFIIFHTLCHLRSGQGELQTITLQPQIKNYEDFPLRLLLLPLLASYTTVLYVVFIMIGSPVDPEFILYLNSALHKAALSSGEFLVNRLKATAPLGIVS